MKPTRERESVETNIISKLLIRLKAIHKLDAIWLPRTFNYNSISYARILWRLLLFSATFFFTFVHLNIGLSNESWTTESNKYKWSKTKRNEDVIYNYRVLNWMVHLNACPFIVRSRSFFSVFFLFRFFLFSHTSAPSFYSSVFSLDVYAPVSVREQTQMVRFQLCAKWCRHQNCLSSEPKIDWSAIIQCEHLCWFR